MATLVLSTLGHAIGGPVGGAIGSFLGQAIDQRIFAPKSRGARLPDIDVQLSAYGTVVPRLYGKLRVAGALIWSTGLTETALTTGGKSSGGRRTQYVYSSSFAIALSARPIVGIARIWADGKLIAGRSGQLTGGGRMRIYHGGERQSADPLIVAREGAQAPCYRGMAYVVFEDLPLADYANRIPNLTFEVEADSDAVAIGTIIQDLAQSCNIALRCPLDTAILGYAATRGQSIGQAIDTLSHLSPRATVVDKAHGLHLDVSGPKIFDIQAQWLGAQMGSGDISAPESYNSPTLAPPQEISISYFDVDHDYQPGLQSATLRHGLVRENMELALPVVMQAETARTLAARLYVRRIRESRQMRLRLPLVGLIAQPGDIARMPDQSLWRVQSRLLEEMTVALKLHSLDSSTMPTLQAETGRKHQAEPVIPSSTSLYVFETRNWRNQLAAGPELWVAVAGRSGPWRGAEIQYSSSAFSHWAHTPFLNAQTPMGRTRNALAAAAPQMWDMQQSLVLEMENPALHLSSVTLDDILDGQNLALVDEEIIAYRTAVLIEKGVYRLSGLLRGLYGTQATPHARNALFVALDETQLFCIRLPASYVGRSLQFRPFGPGDTSEAIAQTHVVRGLAMAALPPVHPVIVPPLENQSPRPPVAIVPTPPAPKPPIIIKPPPTPPSQTPPKDPDLPDLPSLHHDFPQNNQKPKIIRALVKAEDALSDKEAARHSLIWSHATPWQKGLLLRWTRQSRNGFMWLDGADVPQDMQALHFSVALIGPRATAHWHVNDSHLHVGADTLAAIAAEDTRLLQLSIAQISDTLGSGAALYVDIILKEDVDGGV